MLKIQEIGAFGGTMPMGVLFHGPALTDDVLLGLLNGMAIADFMALLPLAVSDVASRKLISGDNQEIGEEDICNAAKCISD
jgi:hypothetical protein